MPHYVLIAQLLVSSIACSETTCFACYPLAAPFMLLTAVSITVSCHCFAVAIPTLLNTSQYHKFSAPWEYSYIRCGSENGSET